MPIFTPARMRAGIRSLSEATPDQRAGKFLGDSTADEAATFNRELWLHLVKLVFLKNRKDQPSGHNAPKLALPNCGQKIPASGRLSTRQATAARTQAVYRVKP